MSDRAVNALRLLLVITLAAANLYYIAISIHWPILRDTSVMHYVIFLMDHGLKPYGQITDNNLPGAYLTERWAMDLFGRSDLAWRLYDFFLLAVITLSMILIARPYDWLAGVFGGGMFALLHASEGPDFSVEREEVLTALLFAGYAFVLLAVRKRLPWLLVPFGLLAGIASAIKPTVAPLAFVVLLAAALELRRQALPLARYLLSAFAGALLSAAIVFEFLWRFQAIGPFFFIARKITPLYVGMNNLGLLPLLRSMVPRNLYLAILLAAILLLATRSWNWERWLVLLGALFGAVSFLLQRKGSIYQRYPFVAFLLLLLGLEFFSALPRQGWRRLVGTVGILATLLLSVPHYLLALRSSPPKSTLALASALTADLRQLGVQNLNGQVQCFDLTFGCFSALYHLDLVENTGFTGDLLFFNPQPSPAADYYRSMFWRLNALHPATVYVITDEWFQSSGGFDKLHTWPAFDQYLAANYTRVLERSFPIPGIVYTPGVLVPPAYRIYLRNGSPLLARSPQPAP